MSRSTRRRIRTRMPRVWRELQREPWEADRTAGGHIQLTHPEVDGYVTIPWSASDWRADANSAAQLKRALRINRKEQ